MVQQSLSNLAIFTWAHDISQLHLCSTLSSDGVKRITWEEGGGGGEREKKNNFTMPWHDTLLWNKLFEVFFFSSIFFLWCTSLADKPPGSRGAAANSPQNNSLCGCFLMLSCWKWICAPLNGKYTGSGVKRRARGLRNAAVQCKFSSLLLDMIMVGGWWLWYFKSWQCQNPHSQYYMERTHYTHTHTHKIMCVCVCSCKDGIVRTGMIFLNQQSEEKVEVRTFWPVFTTLSQNFRVKA